MTVLERLNALHEMVDGPDGTAILTAEELGDLLAVVNFHLHAVDVSIDDLHLAIGRLNDSLQDDGYLK